MKVLNLFITWDSLKIRDVIFKKKLPTKSYKSAKGEVFINLSPNNIK
jgi:hypothetical protein